MPVEPGKRYASCARLREPDSSSLAEADMQRLWFEECYRNPLTTTTGETIRMLQPGFWNKGAGPDFTHACLLNGQGEKEVGAIEIHPRPPDWIQHGHDRDRNYEGVILHVVWQLGPRTFFPGTEQGRALRQIELAPQLRAPVARLRSLLTARPEEVASGVRLGRCRQELAALPADQVRDLLRDAGWFRFRTKTRLFNTRAEVVGPDQALWLGIAEGMGYAENREPFRLLARRLPLAELRALPPPVREARLYGLAGFMPDRLIDLPDPTGRKWLRSLWDAWWKERDQFADEILPPARWTRAGVRPANRPERRLAALVALLHLWPSFIQDLANPDQSRTETLLAGLQHPFWSHHLGWHSAARPAPIALLGKERIERLLFNTLWPAAHSQSPAQVESLLLGRKVSGLNRSVRRAAVRLLPPSFPTAWTRELLVQEGLIQVFHDFCLNETEHCATCDFPEFVRAWSA